ncbi:hypothetical protein [uncultured Tateyamaria sp.]|uniref:hypothetical protein n=1 Tax=uncultured Tateyamaria sp. TaxID=455651 RepID=UPI00261D0FAC|nr:hypothetical protein [uncultured Tateyamaria sp.]
MTGNTEFEQRLARIRANQPAQASRPEAPKRSETPTLRPAPKPPMRWQLVSSVLGLALMAGLIGYVWDDIAILFPRSEDGRQVSYLESALRDTMSEDEIRRMNNDPDLEGMTQMQKMILSH